HARRAAPVCAAGPPPLRRLMSDQFDPISFEALAAIDDIDPHPLAWAKRLDAAAAQRRDVHEDVFASAVRRDEAIALIGLEPLHCTFDALRGSPRRAVLAIAVLAIAAAAPT